MTKEEVYKKNEENASVNKNRAHPGTWGHGYSTWSQASDAAEGVTMETRDLIFSLVRPCIFLDPVLHSIPRPRYLEFQLLPPKPPSMVDHLLALPSLAFPFSICIL